MEKPLQALDEIQQFLALHDIQHVVIGGIANAIWGRPRVTLDADLKVLAGQRTGWISIAFLTKKANAWIKATSCCGWNSLPKLLSGPQSFNGTVPCCGRRNSFDQCPIGQLLPFMYNTSRPATRPGGFVIGGCEPRPGT